jgi:RNA polymerase sigma factor (sigma-70 family)
MSASNDEKNEQVLVEQLRARDPVAEGRLFRKVRRSLWRQALNVVSDPALEGPEDHVGDDPLPARDEETPETILLRKEAASRAERALDTLTRRERSVVVLRDFQGVSPAEACEVLEITDLAQRVHLSRARATLRRALEEEDRRCA